PLPRRSPALPYTTLFRSPCSNRTLAWPPTRAPRPAIYAALMMKLTVTYGGLADSVSPVRAIPPVMPPVLSAASADWFAVVATFADHAGTPEVRRVIRTGPAVALHHSRAAELGLFSPC